jgi:hypothetical protein
MEQGLWEAPSGRERRWVARRSSRKRTPGWARLAILLSLMGIGGTLVWQGAKRLLRSSAPAGSRPAATPDLVHATVPWQRDATNSFETAAHDATAGNPTAAEMDVDRGAAVISSARLQPQAVANDFFDLSLQQLDRVLAINSENHRLNEHVTLARIELAQLRSAQADQEKTASDGPPADAKPSAQDLPGQGDGVVPARAPRSVAARATLNPATLHGKVLDARLMPSMSEILEPPSARMFVDDVRVEDLTLEGATQTLDGIHWKNVTFIGTRLRYEGGELSLHNVNFIRCTFGISTDSNGARLATAIARGQTSIAIE